MRENTANRPLVLIRFSNCILIVAIIVYFYELKKQPKVSFIFCAFGYSMNGLFCNIYYGETKVRQGCKREWFWDKFL